MHPFPNRPLGHPITAFLLCALVAAACSDDGESDKDSDEADAALVDSAPSDDTAAADVTPQDDSAGQAGDDTAEQDTGPAVEEDTGFDVQFPTGDSAGCKPDCTGRICGDDGCGSVCGFCPTGKICVEDGTLCDELCKPDCDGKKCGDNGCGGDCGTCPGGFSCGIDFLCYEDACIGDCSGKVCGNDGCGQSCGECAGGDLCDAFGQCIAGPCKGVDPLGQCDSEELLVFCEGSGFDAQKKAVDCSKQPGKICGYDSIKGAYGCIPEPPCEPSCVTSDGTKKECGSDGCEGSCGVCPDGWSCPGGFCEPQEGAACGALFPQEGKCSGSKWIFCNTGKIESFDCAEIGSDCKYDPAKKKFGCD